MWSDRATHGLALQRVHNLDNTVAKIVSDKSAKENEASMSIDEDEAGDFMEEDEVDKVAKEDET